LIAVYDRRSFIGAQNFIADVGAALLSQMKCGWDPRRPAPSVSGVPPYPYAVRIGPFLGSAGLLGGMADNRYTSAFQNSTLFSTAITCERKYSEGIPTKIQSLLKLCFSGERELVWIAPPRKCSLMTNTVFPQRLHSRT